MNFVQPVGTLCHLASVSREPTLQTIPAAFTEQHHREWLAVLGRSCVGKMTLLPHMACQKNRSDDKRQLLNPSRALLEQPQYYY